MSCQPHLHGRSAAVVTLIVGSVLGPSCRYREPVWVAERSEELFGRSRVGDADQRLAPPRSDAHPLDLAGYLRAAFLDNAGLRAAYHRWRAAVHGAAGAGWWPEPSLTYAGFVEELQTRTGPQRHRLGLTQPLAWPARLSAEEDVARMRAEAAWWEVIGRRLAIEREVRRTYFEYAFLRRQVELDEENLELLRGLLDVVRRRIQAGAPQADLLRLEVEIGQLEDHLAGLRELRPVHSAALAAAINRDGGAVLPWPMLEVPEVVAVEFEPRRRALLAHNPTLHALRSRVRAAEHGVDVASYHGWPGVSVGVDWMETGAALLPNTPDSGNDPWALRVQMSLPVWRGRYAAARAEAQSNLEAATSSLIERRNTFDGELAMAVYALNDAARQVALYRDQLLPRARQTLSVTQSAYVGGQTSFLEVMDSQRTVLAFEQSYWRACADYEIGRADLDALCGGSSDE